MVGQAMGDPLTAGRTFADEEVTAVQFGLAGRGKIGSVNVGNEELGVCSNGSKRA